MLHEYNECYLYHSFMQAKPDRKVKQVWELHLNMELEQLRIAADLLRAHDGRDPAELLPAELSQPLMFEPNEAYLRHLLDTQIDLPVINAHRDQFGADYRLETEGPHPAPRTAATATGQQPGLSRAEKT